MKKLTKISDEGWWALAWIAAYDLTWNPAYLTQAEIIFKDMNGTFGNANCSQNSGGTGGIWWDRPHTYVNAIANELFFSAAAALALRGPILDPTYVDIAKQQLAWFQGSGMINSDFTISDGLNENCQNNGGTIWTYNQGVILGGLVDLSKATLDPTYIDLAHKIAAAGIAVRAPTGILSDPCEPNCGVDGAQFKGVFMRNLLALHKASPKDTYKSFLIKNGISIWENNRDDTNELGVSWAGPFVSPADASSQSSAMDALVAAVAVRGY